MTSTQYRTQALAARDRQLPEEIRKKSQNIHAHLHAVPQVEQAGHIFSYLHFRSEVETLELVKNFLQTGKKVSIPLCHTREHRLDAIEITDLEKELAPGNWGIPEPLPQFHHSRKIDPSVIDVILMPGAVFDQNGGRFGYGGGFYDRFVSAIPAAVRIALAFELQLVEKLPLEPHDELVDYIVTEKRIINCKRGDLVNSLSDR